MTDAETDPGPRTGDASRDEEGAALDTVRELEGAVRDLAAALTFESEPSHHARLLDELAPEARVGE